MTRAPVGVEPDDPRWSPGTEDCRDEVIVRIADAESRAWLRTLRASGREHDDAVGRLHALLLRAARFEVARRRRMLTRLDPVELDDIALQSADDALLAVLAKLDRFRGNSRFTTWAYKFAILEAAMKLRSRAWADREATVTPDRWLELGDTGLGPDLDVEQRELMRAVIAAIRSELTPHQREVLVSVTIDGVPIDVLAERLGTTRGALYKTIYDARGRLRERLRADGLWDGPWPEPVAREGADYD